MTTRRRSFSIAVLFAALAGCGGAGQPGAYPEEPLPPTAEGTLAMIDRAEGDLRLALGEPVAPAQGAPAALPSPAPTATAPGDDAASHDAPSPPPPPAAPPPPQPAPAEAAPTIEGRSYAESLSSDRDRRAEGAKSANDPCSNACRALASMERAAEHLCSLTGSADARCEGARARFSSARARVRAQCPSCAVE